MQRLSFAYGTEDFDYDRRGGRLLVSAQDRRRQCKGRPRPQGAIWAVPMAEGRVGTPYRLEILPAPPAPFHPVGLSLWDGGDRRLVFVVNRPPGRAAPPTVEVFELKDRALQSLSSIARAELRRPNGIVAAGPDEVYVSNDGRTRFDLLDGLAKAVGLRTGNVLRCTSKGCTEVARRIAFANGLVVSEDGSRLYVAAFGEKRIRVFERRKDGSLGAEREAISLRSHPDNLKWEDRAAGLLNVACHRSGWATFRHLRDPERHAPSEGFRVRVSESAPPEELFGPGERLSAASTALVIDRKVFVSFLVEDGIAVLDAPGR